MRCLLGPSFEGCKWGHPSPSLVRTVVTRLVVAGLLFALLWQTLALAVAEHWTGAKGGPAHRSAHVLQLAHVHHDASGQSRAGVDAFGHLVVDDATQALGLVGESARHDCGSHSAGYPEEIAKAMASIPACRLFRPPRVAG